MVAVVRLGERWGRGAGLGERAAAGEEPAGGVGPAEDVPVLGLVVAVQGVLADGDAVALVRVVAVDDPGTGGEGGGPVVAGAGEGVARGGEVGGGVPESVWNGKRRRYSISPHLTYVEINTLLDEVAVVLEKDPDADVERMCADRLTESHGVLGVEDWMQGIDPCEEYGITADSTDDDLVTIGAAMDDYATGEGCTITGVSDYCEHLRDDLRSLKEEQ